MNILFFAQVAVPVALILWMALAPPRSASGFVIQFGAAVLIGWRFSCNAAFATSGAAGDRVPMPTRCSPIENQEAGAGVLLLVTHGSGGGHDQRMAFASTQGNRR